MCEGVITRRNQFQFSKKEKKRFYALKKLLTTDIAFRQLLNYCTVLSYQNILV